MSLRRLYTSKKAAFRLVMGVGTGLLVLGLVLASFTYLYIALQTARADLARQRDLTDAAVRSADFWQERYNALRYVRPLTPAQKALVRRWEKAQFRGEKP